jgi:hypothetical protein
MIRQNCQLVEAALEEERLQFRVRVYRLLIKLWTFLTQLLGPDHLDHQAVLSLIAFLVSNGQAAGCSDTGNYCRAVTARPIHPMRAW